MSLENGVFQSKLCNVWNLSVIVAENMYHIIMSGQENLEPKIITDIFGNEVAIGKAEHLGQVSIYIWHNLAQTPIMIKSEEIDLIIDELIDQKVEALEMKKEILEIDDMHVSECCSKIIYGNPYSNCPYCDPQ